MSRFTRRQRRKIPVLNTAALPDLIFTMLFFFMIVTDTGEPVSSVPVTLPEDTRLETLDRDALVHTLYVGRQDSAQLSASLYLQLDYQTVDLGKLAAELRELREAAIQDGQAGIIVTLKADADLDMSIVEAVKQALREAGVTHIRYAADELPDVAVSI